ncbi:T9SS type A sorting domain-containing protein [bacterium]|nr:T9SS type A sorting domain-containing protein [bacterium]
MKHLLYWILLIITLPVPLFGLEFTEHLVEDSLARILDIHVCDIDSDGDFDILCSEYVHEWDCKYRLLLFEKNDDQEFITHEISNNFGFIEGINAIDFDGDDDIDIIVAGGVNDSKISIMENVGNLEFEKHSFSTYVSDSFWRFPSQIGVADFDGNGFLDIAVAFLWVDGWMDHYGGLAWFSQNEEDRFTGEELVGYTDAGWFGLAVFDFDGDDSFDIIAEEIRLWGSEDSLRYGRWMNDGEGNFEYNAFPINEAGPSIYSDLNSDGYMDIITGSFNERRDSFRIIWLESNERYEYSEHEIINEYFSNVNAITTADFDDDGDIDIVAVVVPRNQDDPWVVVLENDGDNNFESHAFGEVILIFNVGTATDDNAFPGFVVSTIVTAPDPTRGAIYWYENRLNQSIPTDDYNATPAKYEIQSIYPNPFNSETLINYSIPQSGIVSLGIYDLSGREVASLYNGHRNVGSYSETWNASLVPTGMFVCRLNCGGRSEAVKLVVVR